MGVNLEIRAYRPSDEAGVVQLWKDCDLVVPWNSPHADIQRKVQVQPELFLVGVAAGKLVATVMAGYEGHRGWINYLAVAPDFRGRGIGHRIMQEAEAGLRAIGCPKINVQIRRNNTAVIKFYKSVGFSVDEVVSMGKRLELDQ